MTKLLLILCTCGFYLFLFACLCLEQNLRFPSMEGQGWKTYFDSHLPSTVGWLKVLFPVPDPFIYGYRKSTSSSESSPSRPILFIPNTPFVSARFTDFMVICARLSWVASDFMETAKRDSMQATRWALAE